MGGGIEQVKDESRSEGLIRLHHDRLRGRGRAYTGSQHARGLWVIRGGRGGGYSGTKCLITRCGEDGGSLDGLPSCTGHGGGGGGVDWGGRGYSGTKRLITGTWGGRGRAYRGSQHARG